jgi:hypothetical protein
VCKPFLFLIAVAVLSAAAIGCSETSEFAKVSGTVTYQGKPVEGAVVAFHCDKASVPATGTTDASGRFTLTSVVAGDGAMPGQHKITVTKNKVAGAVPSGAMSMEQALQSGGGAMAEQNSLPRIYANAGSTPLTETVSKENVNDFTVVLTN